MDLVEQVHIHGFTNIHTFEPNISLIRLFSLILIMQNPECLYRSIFVKAHLVTQYTKIEFVELSTV